VKSHRAFALSGLVLVLAACSPSASPTDSGAPSEAPASAPSEAPASGPASEAPSGLALRVVETSAGSALAGENGLTLYIHTQEGTGTIVCTEGCLDNWPPLTGAVEAGDADAALLGTVTRPDGIEQVTYNGYPLYYFIGDAAEGEATGEGLNGVWFIADPAGN
jgi:predicted lipoprotein with Yx(FWY)xxD motif